MNTTNLTARLIVDYSLLVLWTALIVAVVWHGIRILAELVLRQHDQAARPPRYPLPPPVYPPPPPPTKPLQVVPDDWFRP